MCYNKGRREGKMKQILLTGAAGSVGYETLKQLVQRGYEVNVLELPTKKNKKRLKPFMEKVHIFYGDINDPVIVRAALQGVAVVIHLAAIIPPLVDLKPELTRKVNFYGTKTLLEELKDQNSEGFFIYASSVSVYGDRTSEPWIQVGDPLLPSEGDYYAQTKIETEKLIQEMGLSYTIFRLTGIMGHPAIDPLMFHMPLDTKLEIASTQDTGFAFAEAVSHQKELEGQIFNLGGGAACRTTYREFLIQMFQIYGLNYHYMKEVAFAEQNFHCGYFLDGDILDDILHFRNDTLDTYYQRVKEETKGVTRFFSKIFSRPVIYFLSKKSELLQAKKKNNKKLMHRFFKEK